MKMTPPTPLYANPETIIARYHRFPRLRRVARIAALTGCALLLASCSSRAPHSLVTPLPPVTKQPLADKSSQSDEPVRGVWLATVSRLDWPPRESVKGSVPAEGEMTP